MGKILFGICALCENVLLRLVQLKAEWPIVRQESLGGTYGQSENSGEKKG